MKIIIECSDDCRGGKNIYGEPIKEIVHCKECKHWTNGDDTNGVCYRCTNTIQMRADDFCSHGEGSN